MGPKERCSTTLSLGEEAVAVAFRKHTCSLWTTASTPYRLPSLNSPVLFCIAV